MSDVKNAADWMLEGHMVRRKSKKFLIHYNYNEPNEEFGLTVEDLRANDWEVHKRNFAPIKPEYIMYIFANKKYKMSAGKLSKQVADGACFGALNTDKEVVRQWITSGFNKLILEANDEYQVKDIQHTLIKYGIDSYIITEKDTGINTALGVQIVDKNKHNEYFSKFRLYKKISFWEWLGNIFKKIFNRKKKDEYK